MFVTCVNAYQVFWHKIRQQKSPQYFTIIEGFKKITEKINVFSKRLLPQYLLPNDDLKHAYFE